MEKRFGDLFPGIPTIIFFDEPSLSSFGSAFSGLNREDVVHSLNECFDAVRDSREFTAVGIRTGACFFQRTSTFSASMLMAIWTHSPFIQRN